MDLKKQLRTKIRTWAKENVTEEFSSSCGLIIKDKISRIISEVEHPKVSIFISKLPEISTFPLIDHLYSIGAKVYIPAWNSGEMWMCHVEDQKHYSALLQNAPIDKIPMPTCKIVAIKVNTRY